MISGASSPEELESLMEDAFVLCDHSRLVELFGKGAVLVADVGASEARGRAEIARWTAAMCQRGYRYLADPHRVIQSRDVSLVIAERALNVMHRGRDRRWRFAISLLNLENPIEESKP
jgi:hypothetical protein